MQNRGSCIKRNTTAKMPAAVKSATGAPKRKRSTTEKRISKRIRSDSSDEEEDVQAQILLLENEVFESKKHYNNIAKLIKILKNNDSEECIVAAISLCRTFTRLMASGDMVRNNKTSEKEAVVVQWLKERYAEYKQAILVLLQQEGAGSTILTLAMRTLKSEGTHLRNGQDYCFPAPFLTDLLRAILQADGGSSVAKEFSEKFVEEHDDVRYYTFESLAYVLHNP
jgi:U3 small nucleolar RNA-associated protein 19